VAPPPVQDSTRAPRALTSFAARLFAAVLAALVLTLAPAIAQAALKATTTSPVSVGTYAIPAPATATWTYSCSPNGRSYTLNLTGYAKVSRATSYLVIIKAPDGTTSPMQIITSDTLTLTQTSAIRGTYTFTIRALVGSWYGTPYTGTDNC
jgi:ABC-type transport system substrate-binding protein